MIEHKIKNSIIIPTAFDKCQELLKPCIESIIKFTNLLETEVIVVANGCTDDTENYVRWLEQSYIQIPQFPPYINDNRQLCPRDRFKVISFPEAIGYPAAINAGIREAKGEFIIPFNNDNILLGQEYNKWIEILSQPFEDSKVAITGPWMMHSAEIDREFLCFFCVMIRKSILNEIGLLDEIFTPGFGEDVDLSCKAVDAGYKIIAVDTTDYDAAAGLGLGHFPIYHKATQTLKHLGA